LFFSKNKYLFYVTIVEKYKELLDKITSIKSEEEFDSIKHEIDLFIQRHKENEELKKVLVKLLDIAKLMKLKLKKKRKFSSDTEQSEPKEYLITQEQLERIIGEKWSKEYKKSIDCNNPKGFSQKAHCAGRKKRQSGGETKSKSPFKK
jgi:hypothetical protein